MAEADVTPTAIRRATMLGSLLLLGAGCAQVPLAPQQQDADAKQFAEPAQDNGALYVYRSSGLLGFTRPIAVNIAGGVHADLAPDTYMRLEGPPGPVDLSCQVGDSRGGQEIDIVAGQTRFVEVVMTTGLWAPGCRVGEVPPDRGQAAVRQSRRVTSQGQ